VDVSAAVVTLLLIMDPIGNIAPFLSILKTVPAERRRIVLVREILLAYCVLLVFLFFGTYLLRFLRLEQETLSVAGGIVLFLIALRMIFPHEGGVVGEPLLLDLVVRPALLEHGRERGGCLSHLRSFQLLVRFPRHPDKSGCV